MRKEGLTPPNRFRVRSEKILINFRERDKLNKTTIALDAANVVLDGSLTGYNLALGNNTAALIWGIATGCWSVATVLNYFAGAKHESKRP